MSVKNRKQGARSEWVQHGDTATLRLRYLPWQNELRRKILVEKKRIIALACAARCGKDSGANRIATELPIRLGLSRLEDPSCQLIPRVNTWIVAPTKKLFLQNWNEMEAFLPTALIQRSSKQDGEVILRGDIRYAFKSADTPENLVAEGLDFLFVTEASRIKTGTAWEESLQPRLISPGRLGLAIVNGSPRNGKSHWFRKLWQMCKDEEADPTSTLAQFNLSTYENPLVSVDDIESLRRRMPERLFRTEILGLWPDDDEKPFRDKDVDALFVKGGGEPRGPFINAVDVARWKDRTYIGTGSCHGKKPQITACKALHRKRLGQQINETYATWCANPGELIVDSTNNGGTFFQDALEEKLQGRGARITGYDFHGWRKEDLFDSLVAAVEQGAFEIREDLLPIEFTSDDEKYKATSLRWQLKNFECEVGDDGSYDYHGPGGNNDDGVTMLGLFWHRAMRSLEEVDNVNVIEEMLSSQFGC